MISDVLKAAFETAVDFKVEEKLAKKTAEKLPVDYFEFYTSISSVYSSKIEGENIDFDSYYKHKFLGVPYNPDYTKKSDDLFKAYTYIKKHKLTLENVLKAHAILSTHLLPNPYQISKETNKFFHQVAILQQRTLSN